MKAKKLDLIQAIRAMAALMVVVAHSIKSLSAKADFPADSQWIPVAGFLGQYGVVIFFVISGFVMVQTSLDQYGGNRASTHFILKRLIRIVPLYWAFTIIYYFRLVVTSDQPDISELLKSLFFIPYLNHEGEMHPVYGLGWTLNYEMYFYIIFALSMNFKARLGVSLLLVFFLTSVLINTYFPPETSGSSYAIPYFWSRRVILFFVLGIGIGLIRRYLESRVDFYKAPFWVMSLVVLSVVGIVLVARATGYDVFTIMLLSAFLIVFSCAMFDLPIAASFSQKIASALGDASYSIYLAHPFLLGPLAKIYGWFQLDIPWLFVILCLIGSSILGWCAYLYFEKPALRLLNGLVFPKK